MPGCGNKAASGCNADGRWLSQACPGLKRPEMTGEESPYSVRLAISPQDVTAAQRLRYQVFVAELGGDGPLAHRTIMGRTASASWPLAFTTRSSSTTKT